MKLLCRIGWHDWADWRALNKTAVASDAHYIARKCLDCGFMQKKFIGGAELSEYEKIFGKKPNV